MIDLDKLLAGDRRNLSKAITLIESTRSEDQVQANDLLKKILPHSGKSFRLGISGSPGVGKSTFIEHFGQYLIAQGHKVAVLAVDPSSPTTGGSILGDKTRMEKLASESNAFIRPTPSSGTLGGVAQKTREAILLCEAAGYDFILVETVGVGQSEYVVADMVDFFMLLILPSAGDELQGIKKGILELADSIIINKSDENPKSALQTQAQYNSALQITSGSSFWKTEVRTSSSFSNENWDKIYKMLITFKDLSEQNQTWDSKREKQNIDWFNDLIQEIILARIHSNQKTNRRYTELLDLIKNKKTTSIEAALEIAKSFTSI